MTAGRATRLEAMTRALLRVRQGIGDAAVDALLHDIAKRPLEAWDADPAWEQLVSLFEEARFIEVRPMLEGFARYLNDNGFLTERQRTVLDRWKPPSRIRFLDIFCARCGAEPGAMCRGRSGRTIKRVHRERVVVFSTPMPSEGTLALFDEMTIHGNTLWTPDRRLGFDVFCDLRNAIARIGGRWGGAGSGRFVFSDDADIAVRLDLLRKACAPNDVQGHRVAG